MTTSCRERNAPPASNPTSTARPRPSASVTASTSKVVATTWANIQTLPLQSTQPQNPVPSRNAAIIQARSRGASSSRVKRRHRAHPATSASSEATTRAGARSGPITATTGSNTTEGNGGKGTHALPSWSARSCGPGATSRRPCSHASAWSE